VIRVGSPVGGVKQGGAIAGRSPKPFPADAGTPSIDRHSGQWHARNAAKRPGEGLQGDWGAQPGKRNGRSAPGRQAGESPPTPRQMPWTISRRQGRMGVQNGGQRPGLWRRGTRVKMQTCSATGRSDHC